MPSFLSTWLVRERPNLTSWHARRRVLAPVRAKCYWQQAGAHSETRWFNCAHTFRAEINRIILTCIHCCFLAVCSRHVAIGQPWPSSQWIDQHWPPADANPVFHLIQFGVLYSLPALMEIQPQTMGEFAASVSFTGGLSDWSSALHLYAVLL